MHLSWPGAGGPHTVVVLPLLPAALIALTAVVTRVLGPLTGLGTAVLLATLLAIVGTRLLGVGAHHAAAATVVAVAAAVVLCLGTWQARSATDQDPPGNALGRTPGQGQVDEAELRGAPLAGVVLDGIDLRGRCLDGADLAGASLRGADLTTTSLRGARMRGADLTGARFGTTDLRGADLAGVTWPGSGPTGALVDSSKAPVTPCEGPDAAS